jgi:hypothetical protein
MEESKDEFYLSNLDLTKEIKLIKNKHDIISYLV